jgi:nitroreductase
VAEPGTIDWVLTTTRAVRRRLDLDRAVELDLVLECLDLALQAPTGGDFQGWRWIVITEPDTKARVRDIYLDALTAASGRRQQAPADGPDHRMLEGAWHLATHLDRVPVLVLACIRSRVTPTTTPAQVSALYPRSFVRPLADGTVVAELVNVTGIVVWTASWA